FRDEKTKNDFQIANLVTRLKNRIDPADLYSVTIRPVGKWRVEIILPTGGAYLDQLEESKWQKLLLEVKTKYPPKDADAWDKLLAAVKEQYPEADVSTVEKGQFM